MIKRNIPFFGDFDVKRLVLNMGEHTNSQDQSNRSHETEHRVYSSAPLKLHKPADSVITSHMPCWEQQNDIKILISSMCTESMHIKHVQMRGIWSCR